VPRRAISMSIRQILKAKEILTIAPDARKAEAVRATLEGEISPMTPASVLRRHADTTLYLDTNSASLLNRKSGRAS
jgi:glucosamine-6-phosphate deaminase